MYSKQPYLWEEPVFKKLGKTTFIIYFILLILVGAAGYYIIGGKEWTIVDSIYMAIITLSTVGYGEVHPLTQSAKIWSIIVIIFGVNGVAMLISKIGTDLMEFKQYRKRVMLNKIKKMKNHYILCGFGKTGAVIAKELKQQNEKFVVIENNREKIEYIEELGYKYLKEDATLDESLLNAGIENAKGIVITLDNDQDNLFVTMSARNLNKDAYLITRCSKHDTGKKLKRAGASKVVNPYIAGGYKMAELLLTPFVEDTVSLSTPKSDLQMVIDEIHLESIDRYDGIMIKDSKLREDYNLIIVGIINENGETLLNPDPHTVLHLKQTVMLIGAKEQLHQFKKDMSIK